MCTSNIRAVKCPRSKKKAMGYDGNVVSEGIGIRPIAARACFPEISHGFFVINNESKWRECL
jgi:hypothetical protein